MIKCKIHGVILEREEFEQGDGGWGCPKCRGERGGSLNLQISGHGGVRASYDERQLKSEIANIERNKLAGFMECETQWRKTLGFSDLGEAKLFVDRCRLYFKDKNGNPNQPIEL